MDRSAEVRSSPLGGPELLIDLPRHSGNHWRARNVAEHSADLDEIEHPEADQETSG